MAASLKSTSEGGATLVLTISNPEQHNALGPDIYAAGVEAIIAAETNPDVRSVVITGEGSTFSAGGNLHRLKAAREGQLELQRQSLESLNNWIEAIRSSPKPVIAAVEGAAAGAGFSLVLACDFVVAADDAFFVMAHSKIGLSPDGGGSWQLARALPRPLVSDAVMRGARLSAATLHRHGLINELTPAGQALGAALALAGDLNARPSNALSDIKELIGEAQMQPLSAQLERERELFMRNLLHANAGEGIAAFLEKRSPRFR
jgi:enoyl-CoA hydratase/carnithine racemase